jgi:hypothetical protein
MHPKTKQKKEIFGFRMNNKAGRTHSMANFLLDSGTCTPCAAGKTTAQKSSWEHVTRDLLLVDWRPLVQSAVCPWIPYKKTKTRIYPLAV